MLHCVVAPCAVDGRWGAWPADWGQCSVTCGDGVSTRTRQCNWPPALRGGTPCSGDHTDTKPCTMNPCPGTGCTLPACRQVATLCQHYSLSSFSFSFFFSARVTNLPFMFSKCSLVDYSTRFLSPGFLPVPFFLNQLIRNLATLQN